MLNIFGIVDILLFIVYISLFLSTKKILLSSVLYGGILFFVAIAKGIDILNAFISALIGSILGCLIGFLGVRLLRFSKSEKETK